MAWVTLGAGLQRGLSALLLVVLLALAGREDGLEAARVVGVAAAIVMAAAALADFGTTPAALRDFARRTPSREEFRRVAWLKAGAGALTGAVIVGGGLLFAPGELAGGLTVAALGLPLMGVSAAGSSKLVADGAGMRLALSAVAAFAAGVAVALVASTATGEPVATLAALPAARLVEAAVVVLGLRFAGRESGAAYGFEWLLSGWPLAAYWFLSAAYLRGQVVAPAAVLSATAGGEVAQGFSIYSAGTLVPGAAAVALAPAVTRAAARSGSEGLRRTLRLALASTLLALPIAAAMFVLAEPGLRLLYGEPSGGLVTYVRWGSVAMVLVAPNSLLLSLLVAQGRGRTVAALWACVLLVSTALQLSLAQSRGVPGAGLGLALAEALLLVLFLGTALASSARPHWFEGGRWGRPATGVALALGLGLAGGVAAPLASGRLAFPDPSSGLLVLLGLPVAILLVARALRYDIFAPAVVFAVPWTAALGVAQMPLYPSLAWGRETWLLLSVPPAVLVAGAVVGAGASALRTSAIPVAAREHALRPAAVVLFTVVGLAAWARFFATIGSVPLLSGRIDAVRFEEFEGPTLAATRFGYVALVVAVFALAVARRPRQRLLYGLLAVVAGAPLILSGGRLYFLSACFAGLFAGVLVRGINRRTIVLLGLAGAAFVAFSAAVWFARVDQQSANPFKNYLDNYLVQSRPAPLRWTIPVQLAVAGSMLTLDDLVDTRYYDRSAGDGLYSTKALDRFVPAKDLEVAARASSPYGQVTTTYLGPWYADFGLAATVVLSLVLGLAMGILYRSMRTHPASLTLLLFYGYAAFWLVFDIYLNFWALHGVWLADVPLLLLLATLAARRRPLARGQIPAPSNAPWTAAPAAEALRTR